MAKLLSNDDEHRIADALKPFADSAIRVTVGCTMSAVHPCQLAGQWLSILKAAGWNIHEPVLPQMYMPPFSGVHIAVANENTPGAGVIQQAFKSVGADAIGELDPSVSSNNILIKFGLER
jgi:hypothetical protein